MYKLYIFDFDGTLVNTFYDSVVAYNKALKIHNKPQIKYEKLEDVNFKKFINEMTHDEDVLNTYAEIYQNSNMQHTKAYPHIKEVLEKLDENPDVTLAICSNRIQDLLDMLCERIFSDINFKYIIGYKEDGPYKPNPEMINQILNNESFNKDEIIYIGDRDTDIKTAKNSDLNLTLVTWGQGDENAYEDPYPTKVISDPRELIK